MSHQSLIFSFTKPFGKLFSKLASIPFMVFYDLAAGQWKIQTSSVGLAVLDMGLFSKQLASWIPDPSLRTWFNEFAAQGWKAFVDNQLPANDRLRNAVSEWDKIPRTTLPGNSIILLNNLACVHFELGDRPRAQEEIIQADTLLLSQIVLFDVGKQTEIQNAVRDNKYHIVV